jgi:inositol-phosphate transport system permease protein
MIRWPLLFVTAYQTLSLLTSFETILLLTGGGPGFYTTEVWALHAYHTALSNYFGNTEFGYGSALAAVLVVIGIIASVIYLRVFRFNEMVSEPKVEVL